LFTGIAAGKSKGNFYAPKKRDGMIALEIQESFGQDTKQTIDYFVRYLQNCKERPPL